MKYEKPFYKYASYWGVVGGTALAFLYLKTLGKDKNLSLAKTLLIGAGVGGGIGLITDMAIGKKPKAITRESVKELSKSIDSDSVSQVDNYLFILDKAKLSEQDNQRILNVINGVLLAKKDKKWDEKADINNKKAILLTYGVTEQDFKVFQDVIVNSLANIITDVFNVNKTKK